ncbi:NACHT domain-containing protein [Streptomyces sp. NPDC057271]|uniref:NACHT domain-containing protein n=1 Tax=unclassified Streptomyces TaxID=2593676 RepID=UPI00363B40DD
MDPQRLVLVRTGGPDGIGSGYLVGPQLVLTALHVVLPEGRWAERVEARVGHPRFGEFVRRRAEVCWPDTLHGIPPEDALDVALLWLDTPVPAGGGPVRWGRPGGVARIPFKGAGFPAFAADSESAAHVEDLEGDLPVVSTSRPGWVLNSRDWPARGRQGERPWAGASGSAVFCHGRLVGVAVEDDRTMDWRRLHAVPIHEALNLPGFARLVIRHGHPGTTAQVEEVSTRTGSTAPRRDEVVRPGEVGPVPALASPFPGTLGAGDDAAALARIAERVRRQWAEEMAARGVRRPLPLRVRWSSTRRPVAADRQVVLGSPGDWRSTPLTGDGDTAADLFRSLPRRQMVVLGDAGGGKSVLAALLTLGLLEHPAPDDPVPVLLAINAWQPSRESLKEFLVRRLREEHPFLRPKGRAEAGPAERLLAGGRLLPVLDGLDELAPLSQAEALRQIDRHVAAQLPIVLTCRSGAYERLVARSGTVLSRSAVVELEPVATEDAIAFLGHPAPARARWQPVFEHLRAEADGMLATVLSSPLMVWLARAAYLSPGTDPAELLALRDRESVVGTLMTTYVTTVYGADTGPGTALGAPDGAADRNAERAARWLRTLAHAMSAARTRDYSWRRLDPVPWARYGNLFARWDMPWALPVLLALLVMIGASVDVAQSMGLSPAFRRPRVGGLGLLLFALCAWFIALIHGLPRLAWIGGDPSRRPSRLSAAPGPRAAVGALWGLPIAAILIDGRLQYVAGLLCAVMTAFVPPWPSRSRPDGRRPPLGRPLLLGVCHGALAGLIMAGGVHLSGAVDPLSPVGAGLLTACAFGVVTTLWAGGWRWFVYRGSHVLLACRGRLPWRLERFLVRSHRLGTMRLAGSARQFRHVLLQDHLARQALNEVLTRRADGGDVQAAVHLAALLAFQGRVDELRARANAGDHAAATRLVRVLAACGPRDELIRWADRGNAAARELLATTLAARGRWAELRHRADAGDRVAGAELAEHLAAQGDVDAAVTLLRPRPAAEPGPRTQRPPRHLMSRRAQLARAARKQEAEECARHERQCGLRAVHLLHEAGRTEEAGELRRLLGIPEDPEVLLLRAERLAAEHRLPELRSLAGGLSGPPLRHVVHLLAVAGGLEDPRERHYPSRARYRSSSPYEKRTIEEYADFLLENDRREDLQAWSHGQYYGGYAAAVRLAELLTRHGDLDGLRAEANRDRRPSVFGNSWVALLVAQGRAHERPGGGDPHLRFALRLHRHHRESGPLVALLAARDDMDGLRDLSAKGVSEALDAWTGRLARQGQEDEALPVLRSLTARGDRHAARRLAAQLLAGGHAESAVEILTGRAEAGDKDATSHLVDLLAEHRLLDELRARSEAGDDQATERLAALLESDGQPSEAVALLRSRGGAGDIAAAGRLADVLARHDRRDELQDMVRAGDRRAAGHLARLASARGDQAEMRELAEIIGVTEALAALRRPERTATAPVATIALPVAPRLMHTGDSQSTHLSANDVDAH